MAYTAPPERGTIFRLHVYGRVRISLVEVYETDRKTVISVAKRLKGLTNAIYGCEKVEKTFWLCASLFMF